MVSLGMTATDALAQGSWDFVVVTILLVSLAMLGQTWFRFGM
jgi:hypothetical protein